MAIKATGSKTIIDLSDGKSLSVYLGSNQPRTQILDVNPTPNTFTPDWTTTEGKLKITPVIYANQTAIPLSDTNLSISWKRKDGSGAEENIVAGESVVDNELVVEQNKLAGSTSGLLTYIAAVTYNDPDTGLPINAKADVSFALIRTGRSARTVWISGEQVFKYATGGASPSPAQITLTANIQGVTVNKWQYKDSNGNWQDYPTTADNADINSVTLNIKPTHQIWVGDIASIRVTTSDANVSDTTSLYKISDGADGSSGSDGSSAPVVFLSNENITFVGNADGQVAATTVTCNVVAYTGLTKVTPQIGTVTGMPTGMTVTPGAVQDNEIPIEISIAANSTLGSAAQTSGVLNIPITSPVTTTLQINWSKVNTGAHGSAGDNAVVFSLYAPNGTVFINQSGSLVIHTAKYDGASEITSGAEFDWYKYSSGSWVLQTSETADSLTVDGVDVAGMASYKCVMTYNGNEYQDIITLIDKTDNYQADIDSTAGDIFKNTVGETYLICRLWQNGAEVDPLKSTTYSDSDPSGGVVGQFYYKATNIAPRSTALMRYSGSAWVDVTSNANYAHERTYKWYRRDKDGVPMDGGGVFATGKVIFVDDADVDTKTVFVCEVE